MKSVATKTELRIIEGIKKIKREDIIYMSIYELSMQLEVAEATLVRFCRKLEYRGFQDFKLSISQELGAEQQKPTDSRPQKVADDMVDAIVQTYKVLDYAMCKEVALRILKKGRVYSFGVGSSAIAPAMMKARLIRAGLFVENTTESHAQTLIASNLNSDDVIILVSVSGATKDMISLAEIAKKNGATIVVITNYNKSPLVEYADFAFYACRKEAAYEGGTLATVVGQSYIIDMICTTVFDLLGSDSEKIFIKGSMAISDKYI
jgi:DNA-binding MurR/RpiR family transcriptional regulator